VILVFDEICFSKAQAQVMAAIENIWHLLPAKFADFHREPPTILALFTEAFPGNALTLGFHATSVAESANGVLKRYLASPFHDLTQIRKY
jgi:hypothetical protein